MPVHEEHDPDPGTLRQRLASAEAQSEELQAALERASAAAVKAERESELNLDKAAAVKKEADACIYAIGHDLRQPLRSIMMNAQLLERRHSEIAQVKEFASYIIDGATEINQIVDALMRYTRAGGSLRRSTLNMKLVLDLALLKVQPLLKESGGEVRAEELPEVNVDEGQFTTVFEQLLTNVVRYRGEEAPRVLVTAIEEADKYVISVQDNGPGVEQPYQEQIFEPLKRLHSKQIPGVGLGLAICRKIVGAHGGAIWVESDGKHGSTFRFTVPA